MRAVAASPCPIVVGVGHETDVTLAEFAADVRAATPSVAAELAVPARADELARLRNLRGRLDGAAARGLRERRQGFDSERRALDGDRRHCLPPSARRLRPAARPGNSAHRPPAGTPPHRPRPLSRAPAGCCRPADRSGTGHTGASRCRPLRKPSPFATLERGYSIVRDEHGRIVRTADQVDVGDRLVVRLYCGRLDARVEGVQDSANE